MVGKGKVSNFLKVFLKVKQTINTNPISVAQKGPHVIENQASDSEKPPRSRKSPGCRLNSFPLLQRRKCSLIRLNFLNNGYPL